MTVPFRGWLAAVLVLEMLAMAGAQSPAGRGPLAARRVTGGPVLALELPTNDATAFSTAASLLGAAGVRFGAEGPALDLSVPLVDFAKPSEPAVTLTGLTVGDALDTIARYSPRLRWSEQDGLIVVRMSNRDSLLDRRLRRFALTDAPPRAALEALIRELAPERVSADGIAGLRATSDTVEAQLPPRDGRNLSLSLADVTVLDTLNAVARANGALTWVVRYDRAPASMANATITLTESRRIAMAAPPEPPVPAGARPTTDIRRISIGRDIVTMLTSYARAANVAVGIERLPGSMPGPPINGLPALNLERVAPDKAVALIVAYDSRYEWRKRADRFLVLPRRDRDSGSVLETRLPSFARSKEPLDAVLSGFLERIGATNVRASSMRLIGQPIPAGTVDAARQKLIDVSMKRDASAREALDVICAAGGSLSWVLRSQGLPGPTGDSAYFTLQITSPDGWQYDRNFSLPMTAPAPVPNGIRVPPDLDRDIDRWSIAAGTAPAVAFFGLAATAKIPIGVESSPGLPDGDPRLTIQVPALPPLGPGRFSDALYTLLARETGYELTVNRGVLNVAPAGATTNPAHVLNQPIGAFRVTDMRTADVVATLRARMARRVEPVKGPAGPSAAAFEQKISLDLANPTPRDVLNEILRQNANVGWMVRYVASQNGVSARVVEADCVIELAALFRGGAPSFTFTHDGLPPPRPAPVPRSTPPTSSTAGRVTLSLPVAVRSIQFSIARVCQGLDIACTVELAAPPTSRTDLPMPTTATYDFTGLSGPEAVARLSSLLPDLTWKQEGSVFRIRSRAIADAADLPLDRKIAAIDRQIDSLTDIFHTVQQLMDRSQAGTLTLPLIGQGVNITMVGPGGPPRSEHVDLHMRDVTVRQILDEIIRQHGAVAWGVIYIEANGLYPEMMLSLSTGTGGQGQSIFIR